MKKFVFPELDVVKFSVEDIITSSDNMTPIAPISGVSGYSEDEGNLVSMD